VAPELAFEYCYEIELPIAWERHRRQAARVVPVILRPALWRHSMLGTLQALPNAGRPVTEWQSRDAALLNVCEGVVSLVIAWKSECARRLSTPHRGIVQDGGDRSVARRRVLDAALPNRVPLGKAAILAGMVRRPSSAGLKAVVEANLTYDIQAQDVQSEPIEVRFSADAGKATATQEDESTSPMLTSTTGS
jgi:hypothetical protein